jgi:hypothetical protein
MPYFELRAGLTAARAACGEGTGAESLEELEELVRHATERGFRPLAARGRDLIGEIHARSGNPAAAAEEFTRAADTMTEILATLGEDDRRSLMHHPDWKGMLGNLLDTLVQVGRREEALGYLVAFGAQSCEIAPDPSLAEAAV